MGQKLTNPLFSRPGFVALFAFWLVKCLNIQLIHNSTNKQNNHNIQQSLIFKFNLQRKHGWITVFFKFSDDNSDF